MKMEKIDINVLLNIIKTEKEALTIAKQRMVNRETALQKIETLLNEPAVLHAMDLETILKPAGVVMMEELKTPVLVNHVDNNSFKSKLDYPFNASREEKILHIITSEGVALRIPEIIDIITEIEGVDSKSTLKSFSYIINNMVEDGNLIVGKIFGSKKQTFFAVADFIEGKTLKKEHFPKDESWGKLPVEKRNAEKIKWKGGKSN
jgi:hypothetical protein